AEGLADLIEAETESQRRAALALAGGALSRQVEKWQVELLALSARLEAMLEFSDEDDVATDDIAESLTALAVELEAPISRATAHGRSRPAARRGRHRRLAENRRGDGGAGPPPDSPFSSCFAHRTRRSDQRASSGHLGGSGRIRP